MRLAFAEFALASALVAQPVTVRAADIPCGPVESGVIGIDGLLEEWNDVPGVEVGGSDADFSFTVKCNYDAQALYLMIDVRDDSLVRSGGRGPRAGEATARPRPPARSAPSLDEDHVEIGFADGSRVERLIIHPGDSQTGAPRAMRWASGRKMAGIDVADALQQRGWAIELKLALAHVPGWSPGAPAIPLAVAAYDCDSKAKPAIERTLRTAPMDDVARLGSTEFAEPRAALEAFLRDRSLSPKDVRFNRIARVMPAGSGRVILAGSTLAFISDEYTYIVLPVRAPSDILDIRVFDLDGGGQESVLVRYREGAAGGWREVLAAFRLSGEGLHRAFAVEVGKGQGGNRLSTKVSFVPRKAATDVVIEPLPAVGWTEANFRELSAEDVVPILLPWSGDKRARFQFQGDSYSRAE